jgi:hypothetical protein
VDSWMWIVIIVAAVVVAAAAVLGGRWAWQRGRSAALRRRFGPEYERIVASHGRRRGEEQLRGRVRRHDDLVLRELAPDREHAALEAIAHAQENFVDSPLTALRDADRIVFEVMHERGYPVEGADARASAISVEYPELAARYRDAQKAFTEGEAAGAPDVGKLHTAFLTDRELLYVLVGHSEAPVAAASEATPNAARPADNTAPRLADDSKRTAA